MKIPDKRNPSPLPGDELRDQASRVLSTKYGPIKTEKRVSGKKVDIYFEYNEFGKRKRLYVEAKDYGRKLQRNDAVKIYADYSGIIGQNQPANLLIVTRQGLSTDADSYVSEEVPELCHQTIWDIELSSVDLDGYIARNLEQFERSGLGHFYIENGFSIRTPPDAKNTKMFEQTQQLFSQETSLLSSLKRWATNEMDFAPVAILGGYGSGKTSLANMLFKDLATASAKDPYARQPVLIKLGNISRFSTIEGLLGGLFTSEFQVPNFNFGNFLSLNAKGRFFIMLDGFDEMKHSMTWADFRSQVRTLLKLHENKAKILLLGRPSAFLSEEEDRYILKGERRFDDQWVRLPDWPQFRELYVSDFTKTEREAFISKYLKFYSTKKMSKEMSNERAKVANSIADADVNLFKKPVHSKILTDLATDPNFDLNRYRNGLSRWKLYSEFIRSLYEREAEKEVRRAIQIEDRIQFLQDLAFWLWSERETNISFSVSEISSLLEPFKTDDEEDQTGIARELLSGSILEKKDQNIFFFGHRSFAEFLVADRMISRPPSATEHAMYSRAFADGVQIFLTGSDRQNDVRGWIESFSSARGEISVPYLQLLIDSVGSLAGLRAILPKSSLWSKILLPLKDSVVPNKENAKSVLEAMYRSDPVCFSWWYLWLISHTNNSREFRERNAHFLSNLDDNITLGLLHSLFSNCQKKGRSLQISSEFVSFRQICRSAIQVYDFDGEQEFEWSHDGLIRACKECLSGYGLFWPEQFTLDRPKRSFEASKILKKMEHPARDNLHTFLNYTKTFQSITEISQVQKKRVPLEKTKNQRFKRR